IGVAVPAGLPCVSTLLPISPSAVSKSMSGLSSARRPVARRRRSIDWCRMSSPSSSSENEARNSNSWCPALIGLKAGEGFLDSRVVGEDPIQGGELQHETSLLVGRRQAQLALAAADLLQRRDHRAEAGRVDEAHAFHVDDDPRRAVLDHLRDRLLERRRAGYVEPARGRDDGYPVVGGACLDFERHRRKSIWQKVGSLATLHSLSVAASEPTQRVLVVEDEEPLAKVMARTLRSRGFECDVALNGGAARALIESKEYAATQLYLLVVNNLRRRSLEMEHRASLERLEAMLAERSEQTRRAAELQAGMLPASPFRENGFEIAAHFSAAREISGDFYDWYHSAGGRIAVTLGDVMGKGLPASLMMATARAALRGAAHVEPLEAGIRQAAAVMSAVLEVNHAYVTLFHFTFDAQSGELEYVDAGHGHARLLRGLTSQELLPERSAPIGIFPESEFLTGKATLGHGDSLVVFSDGLLDLRPDLGTKDVQLPYEARRASSAQEMVDILAQGAGERALADDVTVVALR